MCEIGCAYGNFGLIDLVGRAKVSDTVVKTVTFNSEVIIFSSSSNFLSPPLPLFHFLW